LGVPFVVGLQGLSATIAQHYLSGLPPSVAYGFTLRDALRRDSTARQAAKYRARGVSEASTLRLARYIIGRTTWDRAVSNQINPSARYFSVPETLRPGFYENHWSLRDCQPQTLFVSQGHYPIKGLHFVVQALRIIIDRHPDTQLFVGGRHPAPPGIRGRLKRTRYAAYLTHLIDHLGVADRVHFVGVLDENEMIQRYVRSNVFISASTVENESNSLSEAKLLGVPVIGSYVGGVVDRIEHGASGFLYQHDAPYMLAHYVSTLLTDTELSERFSARSRTESLALNDPRSNAQLLWDAYRTILRESDS